MADWRYLALCRGHDPALWFPGQGSVPGEPLTVGELRALAVCAHGPVSASCRERAVGTGRRGTRVGRGRGTDRQPARGATTRPRGGGVSSRSRRGDGPVVVERGADRGGDPVAEFGPGWLSRPRAQAAPSHEGRRMMPTDGVTVTDKDGMSMLDRVINPDRFDAHTAADADHIAHHAHTIGRPVTVVSREVTAR